MNANSLLDLVAGQVDESHILTMTFITISGT
jgi:hypothetical protein